MAVAGQLYFTLDFDEDLFKVIASETNLCGCT
jgi:hypothetical protein